MKATVVVGIEIEIETDMMETIGIDIGTVEIDTIETVVIGAVVVIDTVAVAENENVVGIEDITIKTMIVGT